MTLTSTVMSNDFEVSMRNQKLVSRQMTQMVSSASSPVFQHRLRNELKTLKLYSCFFFLFFYFMMIKIKLSKRGLCHIFQSIFSTEAVHDSQFFLLPKVIKVNWGNLLIIHDGKISVAKVCGKCGGTRASETVSGIHPVETLNPPEAFSHWTRVKVRKTLIMQKSHEIFTNCIIIFVFKWTQI